MAQTKKKRRRKHRGTQGGRIDRRPARGRARSRSEAQARARSRTKKKSGPRVPEPPTRSGALKKGGIAAVLFVAVLALFGQSPAAAVIAGIVIFPAYTVMSYLIDRFIYRRYLRKEEQKRTEREADRRGARQTEG
jgi:hypothetical protein